MMCLSEKLGRLNPQKRGIKTEINTMDNSWAGIAQLKASEIRKLQNRKLFNFLNDKLYPFSPFYRKLFDDHKINPRHIHTVEDLKNIPFTSKESYLDTAQNSDKFMDFILRPDKEKIQKFYPKRQLLNLFLMSMVRGSGYTLRRLQEEYHPLFITFTTGTTNKPVP